MSKKRYTLTVGFKGATPSRLDIRDALAKKVKAEAALTVVKHIYTRYGVEKAKVIAHIYQSKEEMNKYEEKVLLEKHSKKKEGAEAAAPAA